MSEFSGGTSLVRVGIIGLSASGGFAAGAHVPALRALDGYELRGCSASSPESAAAAAAKHDVPLAFGSAELLAASDEIDLVVVTVKTPHHYELVMTALQAGKAVLCEWPLGNGSAQSAELAAEAHRRGLRTAVGLQARAAAPVLFLRDLVADGYVGEVLSTTIIGSGVTYGAHVPPAARYSLDPANGATMLSIPMGHTLDAACLVLGEFTDFTSTLTTRRPVVHDSATGEALPMSVPDQIAVSGRWRTARWLRSTIAVGSVRRPTCTGRSTGPKAISLSPDQAGICSWRTFRSVVLARPTPACRSSRCQRNTIGPRKQPGRAPGSATSPTPTLSCWTTFRRGFGGPDVRARRPPPRDA